MEFVICIKNQDYTASLETRKIYPVAADEKAAMLGMVRVIDESGEDYWYPANYFMAIALPEPVKQQILALAG